MYKSFTKQKCHACKCIFWFQLLKCEDFLSLGMLVQEIVMAIFTIISEFID